MNKTRLWVIGTTLFCAGIIAISAFAGPIPQLTDPNNQLQLAKAAEQQNDDLEARLQELSAPQSDAAVGTADPEKLRTAIPATDDNKQLLQMLAALESSTGVKVTGFTSGDATAAMPEEEAPAAETSDAEAEDGDDPDNPAADLEGSVPVAPAVQMVPFTLNFSSPSQQAAISLIDSLQFGGRLITVDMATFSSNGSAESSWNGTITGAYYFYNSNPA